MSDGVLGADPRAAEARARDAFWRLLTDASTGNPKIALAYWLDALRWHEQGVALALVRPPAAADLQDVPDRDLFVLSAVLMHDGLDVAAAAAVLNLPASICRASCRHLEARGVFEEDVDERYRVALRWMPAVTRVLRQKHFLHGR